MENDNLNLSSEIGVVEIPKFRYEPTETLTEEIPVYDENGNQTGTETRVIGRILKKVWTDEEVLAKQQVQESIIALKAELAKVKEDIEQETFGLVRDDYDAKKARAAKIVNELRVLEGKEPRAVKND